MPNFELGYTTTDYDNILTVEEREMQTLSLDALCAEMLLDELAMSDESMFRAKWYAELLEGAE